MRKLFKNSILCGDLEYHCLLCEESFWNEDSLERHIRWEDHRKAMKNKEYVKKFKNDLIVEIKQTYHCEACNLLLPNTDAVTKHIAEEKHKINKTNPNIEKTTLIKRENNFLKSVIAFNEIKITDKAWNGIVEKKCILCNTDIRHFEDHRRLPQHVINLIQAKTHSGIGKTVFRMVNKNTFYCLTCNQTFPQSVFVRHWDSAEHENQYAKCMIVKKNETTDYDREQSESPVISDGDVNAELEIKDYIYTNRMDGRAECLLCDCVLEKKVTKHHVKSIHHQTLAKAQQEYEKQEKSQQISAKAEVNNNTKANKPSFNDEFKQNIKKMFNSPKVDTSKSKSIVDRVNEFEKEGIEINFESNSAKCKNCTFALALDIKAISDHIKFHKKVTKGDVSFKANNDFSQSDNDESNTDDDKSVSDGVLKDHGHQRQKMSQYGKKHYIKLHNPQQGWAWCFICHVQLSAHLNVLKQHVTGQRHKASLKLKQRGRIAFNSENSKNANYRSVPYKKFLTNTSLIEDLEIFIINWSYCLNIYSVALCKAIDKQTMVCFACDTQFPKTEVHAHCDSSKHAKNVDSTRFLISLDEEFVREITPGLYHCGFCNEIYPGWQLLDKHINTLKHKYERLQLMKMVGMTNDDSGSDDDDDNQDYDESDDDDNKISVKDMMMLMILQSKMNSGFC